MVTSIQDRVPSLQNVETSTLKRVSSSVYFISESFLRSGVSRELCVCWCVFVCVRESTFSSLPEDSVSTATRAQPESAVHHGTWHWGDPTTISMATTALARFPPGSYWTKTLWKNPPVVREAGDPCWFLGSHVCFRAPLCNIKSEDNITSYFWEAGVK